MRVEDAKKTARVTTQAIKDSWNRYEKDYYPKKALEFDLSQYKAENYVKMIPRTHDFLFVAEERDKIVGVAVGEILRVYENVGGLARLSWICVHPLKQHQGAGKALLSKVIEYCRAQKCHKITLYTLPVLTPALNLYFKTGFVPEAFLRKEWWKVGFIKMSLWLEKQPPKQAV